MKKSPKGYMASGGIHISTFCNPLCIIFPATLRLKVIELETDCSKVIICSICGGGQVLPSDIRDRLAKSVLDRGQRVSLKYIVIALYRKYNQLSRNKTQLILCSNLESHYRIKAICHYVRIRNNSYMLE